MSDVEAVTTVTHEEFLNMARRSIDEIKTLRAQVQLLAPKAQAFDCIAVILGGLVQPPSVMGEDLAALLDRRVQYLTRKEEPPKKEDQPKPAKAS